MTTEQTKAATDKATELIEKFYNSMPLCADRTSRWDFAKDHAIILCDEMLSEYENHHAVNWNNQREGRKLFYQTVRQIIKNK